ncbi:MAG: hypothetical protein CSB55_03260 [Candidatus Cloacimonadota bacterium]|nr:MAG: hypothetical protein CSB55_03260 [Candidatus Cloacimonadota bacterium]
MFVVEEENQRSNPRQKSGIFFIYVILMMFFILWFRQKNETRKTLDDIFIMSEASSSCPMILHVICRENPQILSY